MDAGGPDDRKLLEEALILLRDDVGRAKAVMKEDGRRIDRWIGWLSILSGGAALVAMILGLSPSELAELVAYMAGITSGGAGAGAGFLALRWSRKRAQLEDEIDKSEESIKRITEVVANLQLPPMPLQATEKE